MVDTGLVSCCFALSDFQINFNREAKGDKVEKKICSSL